MARYFLDTPSFNLLPASCYSDASDLWAASEGRPLEERNEALIRFFEEKEKELKARTIYEGPVDEKDGGVCNLDRGSEELEQVSVKGEAGVADSSENRTKGGSHITSELLAGLAQTILEEGLKDNTVASFEVMDADEDETAGGIWKLLGLEKKHPRNERGQVSVEGEQEHKKVRIAESSRNEEPFAGWSDSG